MDELAFSQASEWYRQRGKGFSYSTKLKLYGLFKQAREMQINAIDLIGVANDSNWKEHSHFPHFARRRPEMRRKQRPVSGRGCGPGAAFGRHPRGGWIVPRPGRLTRAKVEPRRAELTLLVFRSSLATRPALRERGEGLPF